MDARRLRYAAAVAALLVAVLLVILQFVVTPERRAPTFLFIPFTALWIFGALMLVVAPRFGAAGTLAWGVISAVATARTHLTAAEDVVLVAASLVAAALAGLTLYALLRPTRPG